MVAKMQAVTSAAQLRQNAEPCRNCAALVTAYVLIFWRVVELKQPKICDKPQLNERSVAEEHEPRVLPLNRRLLSAA
jgi:hypothetical protein